MLKYHAIKVLAQKPVWHVYVMSDTLLKNQLNLKINLLRIS